MKPSAYKYRYKNHSESITDCNYSHESISEKTPLYAIDFTKYALVPREPTDEIIMSIACRVMDSTPSQIYKAMIKSTPKIEDL